MKKKEKLNRKL